MLVGRWHFPKMVVMTFTIPHAFPEPCHSLKKVNSWAWSGFWDLSGQSKSRGDSMWVLSSGHQKQSFHLVVSVQILALGFLPPFCGKAKHPHEKTYVDVLADIPVLLKVPAIIQHQLPCIERVSLPMILATKVFLTNLADGSWSWVEQFPPRFWICELNKWLFLL